MVLIICVSLICRGLTLSSSALAGVTQYLLTCLVSNGASKSAVASFICQSLPKSTSPDAALQAAHQLLDQLLSTATVSPAPSSQRLCQQIIDFYTPKVLVHPAGRTRCILLAHGCSQALQHLLCKWLLSSGLQYMGLVVLMMRCTSSHC